MTNIIEVENKIITLRNQQVILANHVAELYGVETRELNQAIKNNPEKFPERFSWVLTNEEESNLRSKNSTSSTMNNYGGRRYNTRVFTEQGVAMLSTILKSKIAVQVSIRIMDAFVKMRHYLSSNLLEQKYINNMVLEHDYDIKIIQESLDKLEKDKEINEVYFNGKIYDAYSKVLDIFSEAKDELIIVDRYTDKTILDMIKNLECNVILITSKRGKLTELDIDKYNSDYHNLSIYYDDTFHDRYFIIDRDCLYHSGNSINHIGFRKSSIDIIHDENVKKLIINDINKIIGGICSE